MKAMYKSFFIVLVQFTSICILHAQDNMPMPMAGQIQKAICVLYATQGNTASGTIIFTKTAEGIKVTADLQGLSKGKHGFHIHEFGDCSSPDGTSAGGHFNPAGKPHGAPMDMMRHEGDMGNIEADDSGKAHLEYLDKMMSFDGPQSILGRSVILHKGEDDLKTQPTGNSGARIACGVIGLAK
jgi:superoxide dismutase, Cu-Zn family